MLECPYVIITRGEKGMIGHNTDFHYISTKAREVEDVTGAGDTVMAVITLAMVSGADLEKAGELKRAFDETLFFEKDKIDSACIILRECLISGGKILVCGNDYGFEKVFSRQVDALASEKDVLV